jgi:hypothetical protein
VPLVLKYEFDSKSRPPKWEAPRANSCLVVNSHVAALSPDLLRDQVSLPDAVP